MSVHRGLILGFLEQKRGGGAFSLRARRGSCPTTVRLSGEKRKHIVGGFGGCGSFGHFQVSWTYGVGGRNGRWGDVFESVFYGLKMNCVARHDLGIIVHFIVKELWKTEAVMGGQ